MPGLAGIRKFFGKTIQDGSSYAAGTAVANTLNPYLQETTNEAWARFQSLPLEPDALAEIVAEDPERQSWGEGEAKKSGLSPGNFDALAETQRTAPDFGTLMRAWRRGEISDADFLHGLRKARLEERWDSALEALKDERLDPAVIANAIVRGIMQAPFPVPFTPPGEGGKVTAYPTSSLDAAKEAAASGIDLDRLFVMTAQSGRPMSPDAAARATFRDIIERVDYERAIAEGDVRPEYGDAIFEEARQIPSVTNYIEAYVRGWITEAQMQAGAARHGMTPEDANLEFLIHGRPLSWHQVFIGLRRGGTYDGATADIDPAFLKALRESNIRPEWYNLAWAQRYNYPAAFVLRGLTQSGDITRDESEQILLYEGWEPTLAAKVAAKWAQGTGSAEKEATAVDLLTLWDGEKATRDETTAALEALGYPADEAARKLDVIEARRVAGAKQSAIGDLHTAFKKGALTTPATTTALQALGISAPAAAEIIAAWKVYLDAETASAPPAPPPA